MSCFAIRMQQIAASYIAEKELRQPTVRTYQKIALLFDREVVMARNLCDISLHDVLNWKNRLLQRASKEAWNNYRRHLRALQNYAIKHNMLPAYWNYFDRLPASVTHSKQPKVIAIEDLKHIVKYLSSSSCDLDPAWLWLTIIQLLYHTGMRRRQLAELKWSDIQFDNHLILLRAETSKTHRAWCIPMNTMIYELLYQLRHKITIATGQMPNKNSYVLQIQLFNPKYSFKHNQRGMTTDQISGGFKRIAQTTGIKISPHRLRHTFATQVGAVSNPPLALLKEQLGHTNLSTTMRYIQPKPDHLLALQEFITSI